MKETSIRKFGAENYLQTKECIKAKEDFLKDHKDEVVEKRKATCLKRHGKENWMQTDAAKDAKEKISDYVKTSGFKEKTAATNLRRYGKLHRNILTSWQHIQSLDYVIPLFAFEEFNGGSDKWYLWRCTKCGNEFESNYADGNVVLKCPRCKFKDGFKSKME